MKLALVVAVVALPSLAAADDWQLHQGLTVEAASGAGEFVNLDGEYGTGFSHGDPTALALHLGVGGFVRPRIAVSGQIVTNTFIHDQDSQSATITAMLLGPGVQIWILPQVWVGGGLGLMHVSSTMSYESQTDGFGFDVRAGITLPTTTKNAFSVQIEALPAMLHSDYAGVSALVGYQYL